MKKKILFYLNADFTHFAIAYFLQKKYDCDLYAIVDITNKPKKFFETQKLVNFKKIWYYHDNIQANKESTISYLEEIERKYEINLWKLAINERIFYRFFDFHRFSRNEILSIMEQSAKLFEKIFHEVNPDFIIAEAPVLHHTELLYQMSGKIGIDNLILSMPKLAGKSMISRYIDKFDGINDLENIKIKNRTIQELQSYLKKRVPDKAWKNYWDKQTNSSSSVKSKIEYITSPNEHEKTHYTYFGRTKFNVALFTAKNAIKKKQRESFIKNNLKDSVNLKTPFIYFPMSVDMERNLLIDSPLYTNQPEIIRIIAKSLPINYELYVKENPAQASREWRSPAEYNEILKIPNVTMIQPTVLGRELIQNCSLVVSIAGASSLEAAFYQKPSIVFGKVIHSNLPSVFQVEDLNKLPQLILHALKTEVKVSDLDKFIELYDKNTIEFDMIEFLNRFNHRFYFDAGLFDVNIDESKLKEFLDEHENYFSELISGYVQKLNSK